MYEYTDRAIRELNRQYLKWFNSLKMISLDELNVIPSVTAVYEKSLQLIKRKYLDIAIEAYLAAIFLAVGKTQRVYPGVTESWLMEYLEEYNPVTMYRFLPEAERKKQRLIEALIASAPEQSKRIPGMIAEVRKRRKRETTTKVHSEIKRALRYWTLQSTQGADNITDAATIKGYKDAGVKYVRWVTEIDGRQCKTCEKLDGNIYPIDNAPPKQHYRCRCYLVPV